MNNLKETNLGLLGFGEAAQILADELRQHGISIFAYDLAFHSASTQAGRLRSIADRLGIKVTNSPQELAEQASVIFSLVTASTSRAAANSIADHLQTNHLFIDLNSSSPAVKIENAKIIQKHGASFVDAAIMDSVPARGIKVPIVAAGEAAPTFRDYFLPYGMCITVIEGQVGKAAAYKMLRSIVTKGLEALFLEGFWAAEKYDLLPEVFTSVASSIEGRTLEDLANTILVSAGKHAPRKKAEMEAALATAREAGVPGLITEGTIGIYEELIRRRESQGTPDFQTWQEVVAFLANE